MFWVQKYFLNIFQKQNGGDISVGVKRVETWDVQFLSNLATLRCNLKHSGENSLLIISIIRS